MQPESRVTIGLLFVCPLEPLPVSHTPFPVDTAWGCLHEFLMQNFGQVNLLRRGKLRIEDQTHFMFSVTAWKQNIPANPFWEMHC